MGIQDRDYIRQPPKGGYRAGSVGGGGGRKRLSVTMWLIIINTAIFAINDVFPGMFNWSNWQMKDTRGLVLEEGLTDEQKQKLNVITNRPQFDTESRMYYDPIIDASGREVGKKRFVPSTPLKAYGHFSTGKAFREFQVWRFVTFQFLHADFGHLLLNMISLWMLGSIVEEHMGRKRYLAFYLVCGIFGAILYLLLNFVGFAISQTGSNARIPGLLFYDIYTPLIGASAGVFGVVVAAAVLEPRLRLLFPPVTIRTAAIVYIVIMMINLLREGANAGGDAAHLGGAAAGWYFVQRQHLLRDFFDIFGNSSRPRPGRRSSAKPTRLEKQVDAILAKSKEHGIGSLTEREKATLEKASKRLNQS